MNEGIAIVCCDLQGGTGNTTPSTNLTAGLAPGTGKMSVLLIDPDPQGHVSTARGVDCDVEDPSIADALNDRGMSLAFIIRLIGISGLALAPRNLRPAAVVESLYASAKREELQLRSIA